MRLKISKPRAASQEYDITDFQPVAIGGMGGSGTRLIAQILRELGYYIGSDLNDANDNLWFALLFKRIEILTASDEEFSELLEIYSKAIQGGSKFTKREIRLVNELAARDRDQHPAGWLKQRARSLLLREKSYAQDEPLGWKAPNTHIVMDRMRAHLPAMKYIHVTRNGLDMAYSTNQNQLSMWGPHFLGENPAITPYFSLRFWCRIHARVLDICKPMGERFLFLNYDRFCDDPAGGVYGLLEFLGCNASDSVVRLLSQQVKRPSSIGRYKHHPMDLFDPDDVAFVRALGFDTSAD